MKKVFGFLLAILIISCSGGGQENKDKIKISMIVDGVLDDKSFNESAHNTLKKLKKDFSSNISDVVAKESANQSSYASDLESLKDNGSSIIWMVGYKLSAMSLKATLENPEIKYGILDPAYGSSDKIPSNLIGITFKSEEGSFLAGYLAAKTTKTGKIGFIGGMQGVIIDSFRYGYEAGAKYANKNIEIISQYAGTFADTTIGRSTAMKMYQDGVDIIFSAAGLTGLGVINVAKELGSEYLVIGVDQDQSYLAPDNIFTSVIKNVGDALYLITSDYLKNGRWDGGQILNLGLKEGVIDIVGGSKFQDISSLKEKIISGEIIVPNNDKDYSNFINNLK